MMTETSIYEYARRGHGLDPEKTALWFYGRAVSYRELFLRIDRMADCMYAAGIRTADVVTVHLPNCPQTVIVIYAAAKLGAICNMVHPQMPPHGVGELMAFAESDVLFTHMPQCAALTARSVLVDIMGNAAPDHFKSVDWAPLYLGAEPGNVQNAAEIPEQRTLADKCAVYLHSSGSTGRPKTIMLSHSALNNCVDNTEEFFENRDMAEYVSLGVLPMFHGFGLAMDVHRNVSFGSELVQMLRWDAKLAVKLIKERKVSLMVGVPAMYYALLNEPDFCGEGISQLKKCYVGGDTVKPELVRAFDNRIDGNHHMFVGFGLTEATTTSFVNTYLHYRSGSSGYPTRGTAAAVLDETGTISPCGEGELVISSKTLMMAYLKDPEATAKTLFEAEGKRWTRTGDHVSIDEEGFVFFKDRIKNIIIRNGYNIYPAQIEDIIRAVPGVNDVCVVGVNNETLGTQNVRAVIVAAEDHEKQAVEEAAEKVCRERLPLYALPKEFVFVAEFPRNSMGKVDRLKLGSKT